MLKPVLFAILPVIICCNMGFSQNIKKVPVGLLKIFQQEVCAKGCSETQFSNWKRDLNYRLKDLNKDGKPEYFLTIEHPDWCGAGGNCDTWIYRKIGNTYKLIFANKNPHITTKKINNFSVIESRVPMGFCEKNVQRFFVTKYIFRSDKYLAQVDDEIKCVAFTPK